MIEKKKSKLGLYLFTLISICNLLFAGFSAQSQYNFKTFSINEGLSSNSVLSLEMDSRGYLWVGTFYGLNRFDGQNFRNYFFESKSIQSKDQISDIFSDSRGRLWVGTLSNLYLYDEELDEFIQINDQRINIGEIAEAPDSAIWVVGYGVYTIDETELSLKEVRVIGGNNRKIEDIVFDREGRIWLGWYDDGVTMCKYVKIRENKELYIEKPFTSSNFENMKSDIVRELYLDNNDRLWFTTYEGINWIDLNRDERDFTVDGGADEISKSRFWSVIKDRQNRIWAGAYGDGLYIFDPDGKQNITNIKTSLQNQKSISCNEIHALFEDRYGNIWIASANGLNKLIQDEIAYKTYYNTPENPKSISSNHVFEIYQDDSGKIWSGTSEGLSMIDYNKNDEVFERFYLSETGFAENFILSLLPGEKEGQFFIGCRDGLYRYELGEKAERIDKIRHKYNKSILTVRKILQIDSRIWLATDNGIHIYNYQLDELAGYLDLNHQDLDCSDLLYDHEETLWLATNYGVKRIMNPKAESKNFLVQNYPLGRLNTEPNSNNITSIIQDNQLNIWIGTYEGIYRYNPNTDEYLLFNSQQGLREDFCAGLTELENEIIAVGLSTISSINKKDFSIDSYSFNTAITNERESFYLTLLNDGKIAMGGINGLKILDPDNLKKDTTHYPLIIQDLRMGSQSVMPAIDKKRKKLQSISTADKIYLHSKSNTFTLAFSSLYFSDPVKFSYAYKLDGYDDDWMYVNNNQGYANYSKLSPGSYVFRVNATNSVGQWGEKDTELEIIVLPPFWLKWYSILFYIVLLLVLLVIIRNELLIRYKLASEKIAKRKVEKKKNEQMQFFINISHELKTPLTLISGPLEHIHRHINKSDDLYKYSEWALNSANKLTSIINEILDLRLLDEGQLKPFKVSADWNEFIGKVYSYFNQMAIQKKIHYKLENEICQAVVIDVSMIEKCIVNLLDNAFKHAPEHAEITLRSFIDKGYFSVSNDGIHVVCSNTGSFISEKHLKKVFERFFRTDNQVKEGSGIGLSATKQFVELHNGSIWCESDVSVGVSFHIVIPLITGSNENSSASILANENKCRKIDGITEVLKRETAVLPNGKKMLQIIGNTDAKVISRGINSDNQLGSTVLDIKPAQDKLPTLLVVEDDLSLREFIKSILKEKYRILLAGNGSEALDIVNTKVHPNLIISDIMMPVMDGFTLCDRIKGDVITSHIPIILLTARPEQFSLLESYKHEANAYIEKPFKQDLLLFCIKSILRQHEILRKYYGKTLVDFHRVDDAMDPNQHFIDSLKKVILDNIDNSEFGIDKLCRELSISQYMLYNKINSITGKTPGQIIRIIRIHKAESLLKKNGHSIKEIQYLTGFNSAKSFRDAFIEEFGMLPSEYKRQT